MTRAVIRALLGAATILAAGVAGCGEDPPSRAPVGGTVEGKGPQHIHGLGIDPADRSLIIATHSGLFRARQGSKTASRIGDRQQDTMGFTVTGPNRFLGSGHPDLRDDLPPLLGLIRSDDAGRTWEPVSLLGQADFHVLRLAGTRIYGVNATDGRLLVSDDGGRTWAERAPPTTLVDLAPAPHDPDLIVGSGEDGIYVSRDAGASWRPLDKQRTGLLTWVREDALYLIDGRGTTHRSTDAGQSWQEVGVTGGPPAALASHGAQLLVALHDNQVKTSWDGGRSWSVRVTP